MDVNQLKLTEQLKESFDQFIKTKQQILSINNIYNEETNADLGEYARYVIKEGKIGEKRNLINGLNLKIYIHNSDLVLKKF